MKILAYNYSESDSDKADKGIETADNYEESDNCDDDDDNFGDETWIAAETMEQGACI